MSYKSPIILPIPDPILLDQLIQDIQQDFQANLDWLEYAFGRAKPFNDNGFIEPRVFYSQTTATKEGEYRDVWPNDFWQSHCFFLTEGPEEYQDYINIPKSRNVWIRPISIVFWVNLHRIDSTKNYDFSEELKFDVYTRLKQFRHVEVTNFVDNSATEVFQGFNIQDTDSKNFAYPFTGFRIFANLSGYEPCPVFTGIPAPTGLIATAISSSEINLVWTDNAGGIYAFEIEQSLSIGGPYAVIDTTGIGDTNYNNTGLNPETEYFYRARATDGMGGFSAYSNIDSATTLSDSYDFGNALRYDGVNDRVDFTTEISWAASQEGIMSIWVKFSVIPAVGVDVIVGSSSQAGEFIAVVNSTTIRVANGATADFTVPSIILEEWNHLMVSRVSASEYRLWWNGVESITGIQSISSTIFRIGRLAARSTGANNFGGVQDDFITKAGVIGTDTIAANLYNGGNGVLPTDEIPAPDIYYNFNQSAGTNLPDLSGNSNNGTLINFADPDSAWETH